VQDVIPLVVMAGAQVLFHPNEGLDALFTASESLDVGVDLGSPVARDYFQRAPFKFDGKIERVTIRLK
jgi:hypothetical protein